MPKLTRKKEDTLQLFGCELSYLSISLHKWLQWDGREMAHCVLFISRHKSHNGFGVGYLAVYILFITHNT